MNYFVYLIKTKPGYYKKSYVGYTNNLKKRLVIHNRSLGAKSTKGYNKMCERIIYTYLPPHQTGYATQLSLS